MAIKRYFASKDNTITNAFKPDLTTRSTASNMGLADVLEVFSIMVNHLVLRALVQSCQEFLLVFLRLLWPRTEPIVLSRLVAVYLFI